MSDAVKVPEVKAAIVWKDVADAARRAGGKLGIGRFEGYRDEDAVLNVLNGLYEMAKSAFNTPKSSSTPSDGPTQQPGSDDFSIGSRHWPGISKLIEEMGELQQVIGKLIAVHGATHHWDGDLRAKLIEEIGDLSAALDVLRDREPLDRRGPEDPRAM